MILWDIETGERLKTFDGHDRGLACIEFKVAVAVLIDLTSCILIAFLG